jgi:hypothetical protein
MKSLQTKLKSECYLQYKIGLQLQFYFEGFNKVSTVITQIIVRASKLF